LSEIANSLQPQGLVSNLPFQIKQVFVLRFMILWIDGIITNIDGALRHFQNDNLLFRILKP
ncbi:MAG: hypothetical protein AAFX46_22720, partial [Cyanobacteria bacterium J06636_27]